MFLRNKREWLALLFVVAFPVVYFCGYLCHRRRYCLSGMISVFFILLKAYLVELFAHGNRSFMESARQWRNSLFL